MSGLLEILIVIAIVLVLFGARRLPALGSAMGRLVNNFKRTASSRDEIEVSGPVDRADPKRLPDQKP